MPSRSVSRVCNVIAMIRAQRQKTFVDASTFGEKPRGKRTDIMPDHARLPMTIADWRNQWPFSFSTPMARCSTCTPRSRASAAQAGPEADRMSEIWRTKQLEYSWTLTLGRTLQGFLDADRARAGLRAGARAVACERRCGRNCSTPISSSMLSRRARGFARAQGQRPQDRHPLQRLAQHAARRGGRSRRSAATSTPFCRSMR